MIIKSIKRISHIFDNKLELIEYIIIVLSIVKTSFIFKIKW